MVTMVEYFSEIREPFPKWLDEEDYGLRNFFKSRTVFYPGSGRDGHPLNIFNSSHSAHCYFFVDQDYSAACLDQQIGHLPKGYKVIHNNQYSVDELMREHIYPLPEDDLRQFSTPPRDSAPAPRNYRLAAADTASAVRLLIYERRPGYDESHGAERFAIFCLGMEARTAFEWFYKVMFRGEPPFAVWLHDCGFGGDFAKLDAGDRGFGDPYGQLCNAASESGLPEFLVVKKDNQHWGGYVRIEDVEPSRDWRRLQLLRRRSHYEQDYEQVFT